MVQIERSLESLRFQLILSAPLLFSELKARRDVLQFSWDQVSAHFNLPCCQISPNIVGIH